MLGIRVFDWRNEMRLKDMMTSAALFAVTAMALPAVTHAGGLLDVDATVGGGSLASAKVNADLGGVGANVNARVGTSTSVNAAVGTTTGTVVGSTVNATLGSVSGVTGATARADVANIIHARARVLGPKRLLTLCITVGAKGCAGASRSRQLALIDAKVGALSGKQLVSACVSVGGGCGGEPAAAVKPPAGNGNGSGASSGSKGVNLASASDRDKDRDMRITCRSVLASPARYESGLVMLCRKIGQ
jgi:hypothetical protein